MLVRALNSAGGGGTSLNDISVQNKTLLGTITTNNGTFTPSEDCIMCGKVNGLETASANIRFNGNIMYAVQGVSRIGYASSVSSAPDTYGIFCPKDTVVTTLSNSSSATFDLKFYRL